MKHIIEEHLQRNNLGKAIELALAITRDHQPKLYQSFILQSSRYHANESGRKKGLSDPESYKREKNLIIDGVTYLLKDLDSTLTEDNLPPEMHSPTKKENFKFESDIKDVFISYSRSDAEVAQKLYKKLTEEGLSVIIDEKALHAGYDFTQFIKTAVKESLYTVSIISKKSLLSTWVTLETLRVFNDEDINETSKFLPCFIDQSFLETSFHIEAIDEIDEEIQKLDDAIIKLQQRRVDVSDLNDKRSRWYDLRNNLNKILKRLQNILIVDLTESNFDQGIAQLIKVIKA